MYWRRSARLDHYAPGNGYEKDVSLAVINGIVRLFDAGLCFLLLFCYSRERSRGTKSDAGLTAVSLPGNGLGLRVVDRPRTHGPQMFVFPSVREDLLERP